MNYFSPKEAARRYHIGRPHHHHLSIQKIKSFLQIENPLDKGLDVACGTGLSSIALKTIVKEVHGLDNAEEMLHYARKHEDIQWYHAAALPLHFEDASFDIITIASGIHWLDIPAFLKEAKRVLRPNGHLVLYDNFFRGKCKQRPEFGAFIPKYISEFPSPPRNNRFRWDNEHLAPHNTELVFHEVYPNFISLTAKGLIAYLTTQSNISHAVRQGRSYEDIEKWISSELDAYFHSEDESLYFEYGSWCRILRFY